MSIGKMEAWMKVGRRFVMGVVLVTVIAQAQQGPKSPAMAKIGAYTSGSNYEYGVLCGAGPELLAAFKAKKQATYVADGAAFEADFAAGRAETDTNWKDIVSKLGEVKARESMCRNGQLVAGMQAGLAAK